MQIANAAARASYEEGAFQSLDDLAGITVDEKTEIMERSAICNDIQTIGEYSPRIKRMAILMGGNGINRYERFARVKKQKLLFTKIRAELKVFQVVEAEINRRA
jgi:hypothetical protein